eukprot:1594105-Pleurochrysis_carterae.AAC.2
MRGVNCQVCLIGGRPTRVNLPDAKNVMPDILSHTLAKQPYWGDHNQLLGRGPPVVRAGPDAPPKRVCEVPGLKAIGNHPPTGSQRRRRVRSSG